jgi:DNA-directed RNA polymerase subunit M/transcription elongation factor TFIIS
MSAKKGGFGISLTYKPKAKPVAKKPVEPPPSAEEESSSSSEEVRSSRADGEGRRALEEETLDVSSEVRLLRNIALEAFQVERVSQLPEYIQELTLLVTIYDADVFWEFASLSELPSIVDLEQAEEDEAEDVDEARSEYADLRTDYYVAIKQELAQRGGYPDLQAARESGDASVPHYYSLVFLSPLLNDERRADDERDGQLLRKDKPVRGAISCTKCGQNLISTRQVQLRGLDEPSTNIYTCYTCPNTWSV